MTDWPVKTLGDVAKWGSGGTPLSGVAEYYGGNIPWCVIGDLTESDVWKTEKSITEDGLANSSAKIVEVGAILIAMYGASIGRTGVVRLKMATNQAIAFAYANEEVICSDYLLKYLQSQKSAFNGAGHGSAQPNISQQVLKGWPIPVPSLREQKRIVGLLDAATARVTELTACYEQARTHANNLFTSALREALESDQSAPLRTLDELCEEGTVKLGRGNIISKKDIAAKPGSYPIYSSARENEGKFGEYGDYMFDEEMITWSIDGGGRLFYRPKHKFSVTNVGGTLRVLDPRLLDIQYLHRVLQNLHSQRVFDWVFKAHPSVIRKVYDAIPVPPLDEQKKIGGRRD